MRGGVNGGDVNGCGTDGGDGTGGGILPRAFSAGAGAATLAISR